MLSVRPRRDDKPSTRLPSQLARASLAPPKWPPGNAEQRPPHAATVAQPKQAPHAPAARPPHPATVAQKKLATGASPPARLPHPATVMQPKPAFDRPVARPPHPATALQPSDPHPAATGVAHEGRSLQPMMFSRFSGVRRLFRWFYNDQEDALLALTKRCRELLNELSVYFAGSLKRNPPAELLSLIKELDALDVGTHDESQYDSLKLKLQKIFDAADRMSSKLAALDLPLEENFDQSQELALPQALYQLKKDTSLEEIIEMIRTFAKAQRLADAGVLRELLDVLAQAVSDAVMKFNSLLLHSAVAMKEQVLTAAGDVHLAYLLATAANDRKKAETYYLKGTAILRGHVFSSAAFGHFSEWTREKAYPKYREASDKPYDTGAIMLAAALVADGFVPDLVVGLPTGGVHAANRVLAALTIMTGKRPLLWTTRPQGVKAESKSFMVDVSSHDIFSLEEKTLLRKRLQGGSTKIAILDDGFVSGETMTIARKIYQTELADFCRVDARTGVIEAGLSQMGSTIGVGADDVPNPADYIVVPHMGMAGRTGALEVVADGKDFREPGQPTSLRSNACIVSQSRQGAVVRVASLLDLLTS